MSPFFKRSNKVVSLGVILSVGFANALPSSKYDDYDQERYERLVQDSESAVDAAESDLARLEKDRISAAADLQRKEGEIQALEEQIRGIQASAQSADNELRQLEANVPQFRQNILIGERQSQRLRNEVAAATQVADREERQRQPSLNRLNQAKAQLDLLQKQAQTLQQTVRRAEAQAVRSEAKAQELEKKMNEFRQGVTNYAGVVEVRRGEISQTNQNSAQIRNQKDAWLKENAHYQPEWDALQVSEPALQEAIRTLAREIAALEAAGNTAEAQEKRNEQNGKRAELNQAQYRQNEIKNLWVRNNQALEKADRDIASNEQKIRDIRANIQILQQTAAFYDQEADKLAPQVAEARRTAAQERAEVAQSTAQLAPVQQQVQVQEGVVGVAQREFDGANTQYLVAERSLRRLERELEGVTRNLEENRQGFQQTLLRTRDLTRMLNDSQIAVQRIDRDIATLQVQRNSLAQRVNSVDQAMDASEARLKTATSRLKDMTAALERVIRNLSDAKIEISAIARSHGEADGEREGTEVGKERGTAEGLENGKTMGLEEAMKAGRAAGEAAKNDVTAMNQGLAQGKVDGLATAVAEAKPFEGLGFEQREKEFLGAKLKELDLANGFRALQQSKSNRSENGDGRYYRPRASTYPHPKLGTFYLAAYDTAYRSRLADAYAASHAETYERVLRSTIDQFKTDKVKYAEGFRIGNREASFLKGLSEGTASGYRDNVEKEKSAARARGTSSANSKYAEPVIQVLSARLKEASGDGVLAPGEEAVVEVQLKNFGLKDKVGLRGLMTVNSRGISVPATDMALPPIPAQSSVIVRMAQKLVVVSGTAVGTKFTAQFRVNDGSTTLKSESFAGAVQTPVQLSIRQSPRILVPGTASALEVSISNITNREQNINVQIGSQASQVQVSQNSQSLKIASGASAVARFEIVAREEALFEETTLDVIATQNTAKISEPTQLRMIVGRPFQMRSSSQGLVIGSNLSLDAAKSLRTRLSLDTYDLRVNGPLSSASSVSAYAQKPIHVAVEGAGEALDSTTLSSLLAHLNQGGTLVVWGDVTAVDGLARVAGVARARGIKATQAEGSDILDGISLTGANSDAQILTLSGNSIGILSSGADVIGSLGLTNEFSDQPGRIVVLGIEPSALSTGTLSKAVQLIAASGASFTAKIAAALKSADAVRPIALDMLAEIRSDDARTDVRWMGGDKKRDAKIFKVVKNLLKGQREIARYYPVLRQAVDAMKDSRDRVDGLKLLNEEKTGSFGDSLQKVFCKNFKSEDRWSYCK